ncbi:hypothetical protein NHX12_020572 [Muraenolepis orangiensis]|uniref:Zinc finger piccolo-type domain-containing protein n=1 Tax=Muraenolepis orangiensis TaxID=630683 RepID=A0A9Q0IWQ9_9TELE|nr:hypothetical protein NHX12_020572 [Muraenolepis orangiensis]
MGGFVRVPGGTEADLSRLSEEDRRQLVAAISSGGDAQRRSQQVGAGASRGPTGLSKSRTVEAFSQGPVGRAPPGRSPSSLSLLESRFRQEPKDPETTKTSGMFGSGFLSGANPLSAMTSSVSSSMSSMGDAVSLPKFGLFGDDNEGDASSASSSGPKQGGKAPGKGPQLSPGPRGPQQGGPPKQGPAKPGPQPQGPGAKPGDPAKAGGPPGQQGLCALCKTTKLNVGSQEPPNYCDCTQCKSQVCNLCGFSPPDSGGKEWLCLNCQMQRAMDGMEGPGTTKPRQGSIDLKTGRPVQQQKSSPQPSPAKAKQESSFFGGFGGISLGGLADAAKPGPAKQEESVAGKLFGGFGGLTETKPKPPTTSRSQIFGFGSSILSSATGLVTGGGGEAADSPPGSPPDSGPGSPPDSPFSPPGTPPDSDSAPDTPPPGSKEAPPSPFTELGGEESPESPEAEMNVGSTVETLDFSRCSGCQKNVCHLCGFNTPSPQGEKEWLCLNCQTQRAMSGQLGDLPPVVVASPETQPPAPAPVPTLTPPAAPVVTEPSVEPPEPSQLPPETKVESPQTPFQTSTPTSRPLNASSLAHSVLPSDDMPRETHILQSDDLQPQGVLDTVPGSLAEVIPEAKAVGRPESSFGTQPARAQPETVSSAPVDTEPKLEINAESGSEARDSSTMPVKGKEEIESLHESASAPPAEIVLEEVLKPEESESALAREPSVVEEVSRPPTHEPPNTAPTVIKAGDREGVKHVADPFVPEREENFSQVETRSAPAERTPAAVTMNALQHVSCEGSVQKPEVRNIVSDKGEEEKAPAEIKVEPKVITTQSDTEVPAATVDKAMILKTAKFRQPEQLSGPTQDIESENEFDVKGKVNSLSTEPHVYLAEKTESAQSVPVSRAFSEKETRANNELKQWPPTDPSPVQGSPVEMASLAAKNKKAASLGQSR